jgi:hypothetical protein
MNELPGLSEDAEASPGAVGLTWRHLIQKVEVQEREKPIAGKD